MAGENLETPSFGNFGIENTLEFGPGAQELLDDLFAPETSTANPNDLEPIVKDVPPPKTKTSTAGSSGTATPPVKKDEEEEDEKNKASQKDIINTFLTGDEEEEEEEEVDDLEGKKKGDDTNKGIEEEIEETEFASLSRDLFKLGVFTKEEDEEDIKINTPEEFLERFNQEKRKGADQMLTEFLGQFGEDYRNAFKAIYVNGVDPKDYFGVYNNIVNFAELDLSDETNQMSVIRQALTDQGFEPEDITSEIERLKNYGDLEAVATKHHKVLVKKEAQKLQEMERKAELEKQQRIAVKTQYVQNVQSVLQDKLKAKQFDGIPLNSNLANELQDFLLVDKYKTASGETLTDFDRAILELKRPENHAMKVKIALLMKIMEKDPTLSTIQRIGATKKNDQLFDELAKHKPKSQGTQSGTQSRKSWFDSL